MVTEKFKVHGVYTMSNSSGYLVELSDCGSYARVKFVGETEHEPTEWSEIIYKEDEFDLDGDLIPVFDADGFEIPLNQVMRISQKNVHGHQKQSYEHQ